MPSTRLKTTAAVWGGVGLAAVTIRALKRWRNRKREERIAKQGGRLPDCPTVVHALAKRATETPDAVAGDEGDGGELDELNSADFGEDPYLHVDT